MGGLTAPVVGSGSYPAWIARVSKPDLFRCSWLAFSVTRPSLAVGNFPAGPGVGWTPPPHSSKEDHHVRSSDRSLLPRADAPRPRGRPVGPPGAAPRPRDRARRHAGRRHHARGLRGRLLRPRLLLGCRGDLLAEAGGLLHVRRLPGRHVAQPDVRGGLLR